MAQADTTATVVISVFDTLGNPLLASIEIYDYSSEGHDTLIHQDSSTTVTKELNRRTNFGVAAFANGYHQMGTSFTTGEPGTSQSIQLVMTPINEEVFYILPNIYFGPHDSGVPEDSTTESNLQAILNAMREFPSMNLEIIGHCTEREYYVRTKLSKERARAIYDILIEAGINEERLSYKGAGAISPVFAEDAGERMRLSRRVVFQPRKQ